MSYNYSNAGHPMTANVEIPFSVFVKVSRWIIYIYFICYLTLANQRAWSVYKIRPQLKDKKQLIWVCINTCIKDVFLHKKKEVGTLNEDID